MKNKTVSIGILSITAVILFIAQFIPIQSVRGEVTLKDRDYSIQTAISEKGGENLFVADNRTGQIVVFAWDPGTRAFIIGGGMQLSDAFR